MPDFERPFRSLELHMASSQEEKSYVAGTHAGMDKARWQVALLCLVIALDVSLYLVVSWTLA